MPEEPKVEVAIEQPKATPAENPPPSLEQVQAELVKAQAKIAELNKGLQTAGQTIKQRDAALNKQQALESKVEMLADYVKEIASQSKVEQDETGRVTLNVPKQDLTGKLTAISQQAKVMADINARKERVEALGLDPDSEEYLEVQDLTTRLNFALADKKLAKLEAAKKQPEPKPIENDFEKRVQEEAQKIANEQLRKAGILQPEGGTPSGATSTYKESQIADPGFWASHKAEILKAQEEGRIKLGE